MPIPKNITKYINGFSGGMIALVVVMVPLGYFLVSYQCIRGNLEAEAKIGAALRWFEVSRSLRPLLIQTALVALIMLPIGLGIFFILRRLPIRAIHQAGEELKCAYDVLETKVQERTAELLLAKDAAEAASRSKSEFLANMSHELRTPLNHIMGFTELVVNKQCGDLNEVQEEYLTDVLQSSHHLLSLINDILDIAKVESGKMELDLVEFNFKELLGKSMNMVKEKAMKHGIKISIDKDNLPVLMTADERKLKQILYNLLSNAVKFTPDGGSVRLGARKIHSLEIGMGNWKNPPNPTLTKGGEGGFIEISVEDTGIGINREDLQRIFDPFEQVESSTSRRYQGTGLGLSLTRNLVELHGGKIWAESEGAEKGSKFTFIIPV